jgi:prolyl-tRNA synthetase
MNQVRNLPSIQTDFSDWYNEVVFRSELIDHAPVRGCMILRPYGYAIWELMQYKLNKDFKKMGVHNCAFPLLIPSSYIESEKDHIEGFAPEIAVVTYAGGKELEEKLVVRPTSETIIHSMFSRWIKSWRDLPVKVNQWCSVIRWEKRPRPFIRNTEFWWQEGHTAHEKREEAYAQAHEAGDIYENFIREYLAIPVIRGFKPPMEKFPGAEATITFEAMMQDGKALQMGTSHVLSQSFCKQFNIKYQNKKDEWEMPWLTSWGVTTRLIGAVIMVHGDEKGLVLPPLIAPIQCIIIPIINKKNNNSDNEKILDICNQYKKKLEDAGYRSECDLSEKSPGFKYNYWELKGVPFRIEIGLRDIENNSFVFVSRDNNDKRIITHSDLTTDFMKNEISSFVDRLLQKRIEKQKENIHSVGSLIEVESSQENKFYIADWCCSLKSYEIIKSKQLTVRCVLETYLEPKSTCFSCGESCKSARYKVVVAKAY